jgi:hypothetical protein
LESHSVRGYILTCCIYMNFKGEISFLETFKRRELFHETLMDH